MALGGDPSNGPANIKRWESAANGRWVDSRLVHEGYVPLIHDGRRYYCRLDDTLRVGTRLGSIVWCGAADPVELLYYARSEYAGKRWVQLIH